MLSVIARKHWYCLLIAIATVSAPVSFSASYAQVASTSPPSTGEPEALCIRTDGTIGVDTAVTDTCEPDAEIVPIPGLRFGNAGQTVISGSNGSVTVGGTFTASPGITVDMGGNRVQNVATPTAASPGTDAANKQYVDDQNAAQDSRITAVENVNTTQQNQIDDHEDRITDVENENVSQQAEIDNNTSDISDLQTVTNDQQAQIDANTADIFGLQGDVSDLRDRDGELAEGIAISLALDPPNLRNGQTFAMRGGWGNFDGTNAAGITAAGALNQNVVVDAGVGWGASQGTVAGKAGVTIGW
jgi:hypothetical protein